MKKLVECCLLAILVEEQRLGGARAFVVAGAWAARVDAARVCFGLRVDRGITIDL